MDVGEVEGLLMKEPCRQLLDAYPMGVRLFGVTREEGYVRNETVSSREQSLA